MPPPQNPHFQNLAGNGFQAPRLGWVYAPLAEIRQMVADLDAGIDVDPTQHPHVEQRHVDWLTHREDWATITKEVCDDDKHMSIGTALKLCRNGDWSLMYHAFLVECGVLPDVQPVCPGKADKKCGQYLHDPTKAPKAMGTCKRGTQGGTYKRMKRSEEGYRKRIQAPIFQQMDLTISHCQGGDGIITHNAGQGLLSLHQAGQIQPGPAQTALIQSAMVCFANIINETNDQYQRHCALEDGSDKLQQPERRNQLLPAGLHHGGPQVMRGKRKGQPITNPDAPRVRYGNDARPKVTTVEWK